MFLVKSAIYRQEIKTWILTGCLLVWGLTATVFAIQNRRETLIIGIDDAGTRIINAESDRLFASELKNFLTSFLNYFYTFDEANFEQRTGIATDLISQELWERKKAELTALGQKLKAEPLLQVAEIESIDLLESGQIEAILSIRIKARMSEHRVRLKVHLEYRKIKRTDRNPWGFEITELSDATI